MFDKVFKILVVFLLALIVYKLFELNSTAAFQSLLEISKYRP